MCAEHWCKSDITQQLANVFATVHSSQSQLTILLLPPSALGLPPTDQSELTDILSAVDPDEEGYVTYEPFLAACALKLHSRTEESISAEVEHAYKLFTRGTDGPIQVSHLRKVARDLKQDVSDDLLKDMVREANGGEGTHAGVNMQQFKDVMMRAGIF